MFANADITSMHEDDFEGFAAWVEADAVAKEADHKRLTKMLSGAKRYNRRDKKGRFVRAILLERCRYELGFFNGADGVSHSHDDCGGLIGVDYEHDAMADGFLCTGCVDVRPFGTPHRNLAPMAGSAECHTCKHVFTMKSFPTTTDNGWRIRDTRECRKCRDTRRNFDRKIASITTLSVDRDEASADNDEYARVVA